jgi:ClpP class serine protease
MTEAQRPVARFVRPGELLAMDPGKIRRGPDGFFWLLGQGIKPNERCEDVTIVHIRGELEHHADRNGCSDSYESILCRVRDAATGQDTVNAYESAHKHEADYKAMDAVPPTTIIACIDSPGGVVAGLNETVKCLQKLRKECPNISFVAYVNEMAASAAYALSCAFEEIICPPSAILGSIGVISTMISQARKNKADGYDVALLTSGARKADGHLHAPITDDAKAIEQARVDKLAMAFFKLASKARGIPIPDIQKMEAGIFLGPTAVKFGLADAIMSYDDVLTEASSMSPTSTEEAGGNETDRRVNAKTSMKPKSMEAVMPLALSALIKKTEAALKAEKDPEKLMALAGELSAYKKTYKKMVKTEEEGDEPPAKDKDEDDDEEEGDEEEESEESAAAMPKKKGDEDEEDDEEEEEEESEEASAKAALDLVHSLTGMTGKKALGALQAIAATAAHTAKDVALLKKANRGRDKAALIAGAKGKFLTKKEAAWLATQPMNVVQGFVEMRQQSGVIVHTDETTILKPKHIQPGTEESLPQETLDMIDEAVAAWSGDKKEYRESLVKNHLAAHNKQLANALNGSGGRY